MIRFPYDIIDLTHALDENIPSWSGECGFSNKIIIDYADCSPDAKFRVQHINMHAGMGTHMDAPAHCIPNAATVDMLQLSDLIVPCVVIDVSLFSHERYTVSVHDIKNFEKKHQKISPGSFIVIRTGWERFWHQPEQYRNNHVFPSISGEAAEYLLQQKIVGLGIDTLSPDRPDDGYLVHTTLLGAGKYIIENVANAIQLPPIGGFIVVLPIKIKGGTEAPMRLIGLTHHVSI